MFKWAELICVLLVCFLVGCSMFGGQSVKPVAELETELELARKDIDQSKKELKEITGNVSLWEQKITTMETTMNNLQVQVTNSVHYNESLKSIAWTVAGIYVILKVLQFIRALIIAKIEPGRTLTNLIKGR